MFNFEKLDVWKKAIEFADLVYSSTRNFPPEERFGLTNQMRRAAVSLSSNIAEGCSRTSKTDFSRFVEIATGSVFEVVSQAFIGRRQGFLGEDAFSAIYGAAEEQSRMLSGLRKSLLQRERK
jgi:four helix bundle protein